MKDDKIKYEGGVIMFCTKCGKEVSESATVCPHCGFNLQIMAPAARPKKSTASIILIVVAVIVGVIIILGIIAALTIPNLLTAQQRAKQRRTMSDMRSLAVAIETYQVDCAAYPNCKTINELADVLSPFYIKVTPIVDGWEKPFKYELKKEGEGYCLISFGKNGVQDIFEPYPEFHQPFSQSDFDQDIILCNGEFISYPE